MRKKTLHTICFMMAGMMLLSIAACGSKEPTAAMNGVGSDTKVSDVPTTVKVVTSETILKCDPHDQQGWPGQSGIRMVMETLIETDHEGNYTPLLADSWEISDDNLTVIFKLRDGITASDGEVFNADDVCATYTRILRDDTINTRVANFVKLGSVEKIDDLTVAFHFVEPEAMALNYFATTPCFTDEAFDEHGEGLWEKQIMIGTGPWCWTEWVDGQYLHLTKNDNYWNKDEYDPLYREFYMYFLTEESSAIASHLAGDMNAYISVGGITPDSESLYNGYDSIDCFEMTTSLFHFLGFQCEEGKLFHNVDLRRAFSMAIDRQLIGNSFYGDNIETSKGGLAWSFTLGYDENIDSQYYEYNPEAAASLIAASGYSGEKINFLIGSNVPSGENIGLIIAEECQKVGLNVVVEMAEIATFSDRRKAGEYDVYMTTDGVHYGETYSYMNTRLVVDVHKSHYVNDQLNDLVKKVGTTLNTESRDALYVECNAILASDVPHINLFCEPKIYAINHGVSGIKLYTDGAFDFNRIDYNADDVK